MVCIVERLSKKLNRKINSEQIWKHLKTMYNLKALDDLEPLPFPNEESNFMLPTELQSKLQTNVPSSEDGSSKDSDSRRATPKPVAVKSSQPERKSMKSESNESRIQPKRTRGSLSAESGQGSPGTPPPSNKRRRI